MSIIRHRSTDTLTESAPATDVMANRESTTATSPTTPTSLVGDDTVIEVIGVGTIPPPVPMPTSTTVTRETVNETSDIYYPNATVGLFLMAFVAFLLSAWAGIVPYVGPIFGFSADGTSSWTWNAAHTYGALIPGAVAFVMCLVVLACAQRPAGMQPAGTLATSGFVVFLCGAWLAVFPVAWAVIRAPYFHAASPALTLEYWLGYASGPGVLLAAFGAFVMGRAGIESVAHRLVNRINVA